MDLVEEVKKRLKNTSTIVFPESEDPRVLRAASYLAENHICRVMLIGDQQQIQRQAEKNAIALPETVSYSNYQDFDAKLTLIKDYCNRNKHKEVSREAAAKTLSNPLYFAAEMVANGFADGCVAGSIATTGEVIRAAIRGIGLSPKSNLVSSTFLMQLPNKQTFTYADCGVVPYPDAPQLANIAIDSARTHQLLTLQEPRVAMLSFSTKGSAEHERTILVKEALNIVKENTPDLTIDGELQFDAAYLPEVAEQKAPDSAVAGRANVFIFPNLDAGNIAYKITERLGGAKATGPILQGLNKPMMDLSRGCDWKDIVNAACVAILMGASS